MSYKFPLIRDTTGKKKIPMLISTHVKMYILGLEAFCRQVFVSLSYTCYIKMWTTFSITGVPIDLVVRYGF